MTRFSAATVRFHDTDEKTGGHSNERSQIDREEIFKLQLEQREHDDLYHPEISRLTMSHRLNHLALHFAKYAGRVAGAIQEQDDSDIERTLTDIFIIALSSANVLNVDLGKALSDYASISEPEAPPGESIDTKKFNLTYLLLNVTSASGMMAKACESVDHLEAIPLREGMNSAVIDLARIALTTSLARQLNIFASVRSRLEQVRSKKIFHGHIYGHI